MSRPGFVRGAARVSGRRLAREHRLVATGDRAPRPSTLIRSARQPKAANRVATVLLDSVERLAELPNLERPGRVAGTRELVVPGTPYVIPYKLRGDRSDCGIFTACRNGRSTSELIDRKRPYEPADTARSFRRLVSR